MRKGIQIRNSEEMEQEILSQVSLAQWVQWCRRRGANMLEFTIIALAVKVIDGERKERHRFDGALSLETGLAKSVLGDI